VQWTTRTGTIATFTTADDAILRRKRKVKKIAQKTGRSTLVRIRKGACGRQGREESDAPDLGAQEIDGREQRTEDHRQRRPAKARLESRQASGEKGRQAWWRTARWSVQMGGKRTEVGHKGGSWWISRTADRRRARENTSSGAWDYSRERFYVVWRALLACRTVLSARINPSAH
jgi:hypothetical protein